MKEILVKTFLATKGKLKFKKGQFEILGGDVILDSNDKAYVLEINSNPSLVIDTTEQFKMKPFVV